MIARSLHASDVMSVDEFQTELSQSLTVLVLRIKVERCVRF
jgi:hypothetical protein